jgi:UDP-N-acetylmuramoylalanine--D-glutamate ligase
MKYRGKSAAVLGLGASGEAAAQLLSREGAIVTIFDDADRSVLAPKLAGLRDHGISVIAGDQARHARVRDFETVVVSPGIDPVTPLVRQFVVGGCELIGELELAFQFCTKPVIAITGTNGKTTTTLLVDAIMNRTGRRTIACGNIGKPFSEVILTQSTIDLFTVEVSSFQLETIRTFRPAVTVWLNFSADHLDRYPSVEAYRQAKLRIFENLDNESFAVVNARDKLPDFPGQRITFSAYGGNADFQLRDAAVCFRGKPIINLEKTCLTGAHNAENIMAALGVAAAFNVPWMEASLGIMDCQSLPHRCEPIRNSAGIVFINDSKATNPDALAKALEAQPGPVVLIAGGKNKGFDFRPLCPLARAKVRHVVLIGEMAPAIQQAWSGATSSVLARDLSEAVDLARAAAEPGSTVLFSPGTSSFDMFRDYADRGNQFRRIVEELSPWE